MYLHPRTCMYVYSLVQVPIPGEPKQPPIAAAQQESTASSAPPLQHAGLMLVTPLPTLSLSALLPPLPTLQSRATSALSTASTALVPVLLPTAMHPHVPPITPRHMLRANEMEVPPLPWATPLSASQQPFLICTAHLLQPEGLVLAAPLPTLPLAALQSPVPVLPSRPTATLSAADTANMPVSQFTTMPPSALPLLWQRAASAWGKLHAATTEARPSPWETVSAIVREHWWYWASIVGLTIFHVALQPNSYGIACHQVLLLFTEAGVRMGLIFAEQR